MFWFQSSANFLNINSVVRINIVLSIQQLSWLMAPLGSNMFAAED